MLDVVGYAGLVERDEEGTLARWRRLRGELIVPAVSRWRGRIFKNLGDGVLIEFATAEHAVRCALEIQSALPPNAPVDAGLELRCAIHLADVVAEEGDLLGEGVNVVARLQEVAAPGGIAVSQAAFAEIGGRLDVAATDLGEMTLKNMRRPIRVLGLLRTATPSPPSEAPVSAYRPSIAVLPFGDPDQPTGQSYFGDGIVEDIVGALATMPDLFVISRNSTVRYRGTAPDLGTVGRELAVRYVLSGSVRRARDPDRIRITSVLSDAETRTALWTERVDGTADDLFALQDRLCDRVVTTIVPHLRQAEMLRSQRKRPESLDAYDLVLRGLDLLYRLRREEFDRALDLFRAATTLDPNYAAPYALGATWHAIRVGQGWSPAVREDHREVDRLASAAIERDPYDARALALCGHARALLFRDFEGAFALFDRAVTVAPNSAVAWVRSSPAHSYVGDAVEARRRAELGIRLSPFDPHLFYAHTALGLAAYTAGEFEEAAHWCRSAMSQNPTYTANLRFLAASLAAGGRRAEGRAIGRALLALEPAFRVRPFSEGYAYKDAARRAALGRHLRAAGLPD
jgi:TolB-like protein